MNKYRNIKSEYNGVKYDSKLEIITAKELDLLYQAKAIKGYERQFRFDIDVNGVHIAFYKADFFVYTLTGLNEIIECKGCFTSIARLKLKLVKALYPDIKIIIHQRNKRWEFKK